MEWLIVATIFWIAGYLFTLGTEIADTKVVFGILVDCAKDLKEPIPDEPKLRAWACFLLLVYWPYTLGYNNAVRNCFQRQNIAEIKGSLETIKALVAR